MADLDRGLESQPPAAHRAGISFDRLPDVRETRREVAAVLDATQMPARPVRPGDELAFTQGLVGHDLACEPDRAERPGIGAEGGSDLLLGGRPRGAAERRGQLRLLEAVVTADQREDDRAVVLRHGHRLRRRRRVDAEEPGQFVDRRDSRSRDLGRLVEPLRECRRARHAACDLEIGCIVAVRARDEGVLARAGRSEVVDRLAPAHHPGLGLHRDGLQPAALEDPLVCAGVLLEAHVEPGLVAVERVGVLHHELAHAQEAAARTRLVTALGLEVVEDLRQVAVRAELREVEGHGLLVRHREDERTARTVRRA